MPIYNDPIGGTTGSVCSVSPSDIVGQVDNLISRVEELEQRVNELSGQNVEANQLSDISNQVGWVYGVTYMGVEGWTQTQAGTLIPPEGFTVSQILADAQARDQLSTSGGSGISSYLIAKKAGSSSTFTVVKNVGSAIDNPVDGAVSTQVHINETALYIISFTFDVAAPDFTPPNPIFMRIRELQSDLSTEVNQALNEYINTDSVQRSFGFSMTVSWYVTGGHYIIFDSDMGISTWFHTHISVLRVAS